MTKEVRDDLGNVVDPDYVKRDGAGGAIMWTEELLEEYGEKNAPSVKENATNSYTICDIHRMIYHSILDDPDALKTEHGKANAVYLLERAYVIAKKMDARLRMYKNNYDSEWWLNERSKHAEWMRELNVKPPQE